MREAMLRLLARCGGKNFQLNILHVIFMRGWYFHHINPLSICELDLLYQTSYCLLLLFQLVGKNVQKNDDEVIFIDNFYTIKYRNPRNIESIFRHLKQLVKVTLNGMIYWDFNIIEISSAYLISTFNA